MRIKGLERERRREKRKNAMRVDGQSVKLLERILLEKAQRAGRRR